MGQGDGCRVQAFGKGAKTAKRLTEVVGGRISKNGKKVQTENAGGIVGKGKGEFHPPSAHTGAGYTGLGVGEVADGWAGRLGGHAGYGQALRSQGRRQVDGMIHLFPLSDAPA